MIMIIIVIIIISKLLLQWFSFTFLLYTGFVCGCAPDHLQQQSSISRNFWNLHSVLFWHVCPIYTSGDGQLFIHAILNLLKCSILSTPNLQLSFKGFNNLSSGHLHIIYFSLHIITDREHQSKEICYLTLSGHFLESNENSSNYFMRAQTSFKLITTSLRKSPNILNL